ncbi:hypothetical protein ABIA71_001188 [Stenotrophomonas sp. 2619]|uniref:hypothetical protein n=1 Tax=Stenotrophomonas sp. 2619 TaxID=3156316 RepID=UPI003396CCB4
MSSDSQHSPFADEHQDKAAGELEKLAITLRTLIVSQPPRELLGYLYSMLALCQWMQRDSASNEGECAEGERQTALDLGEAQFLLEYVHAAYATSPASSDRTFDEGVCTRIIEVAGELRETSMVVAMMVAASSEEAQFGEQTRDLIFRALSNWIMLRGHRHQVLEEEFLSFALAPHDEALRRVYGVGSSEIARGIQDLADAIRLGHGRAAETIRGSMEDAQEFLQERGVSMEDGLGSWQAERPEMAAAVGQAVADLFQGRICNVTQQTKLPAELLDDLSYSEGEELDFYAPGPYSGTPLRTLPARKKPLIKLDHDSYQVDPSFTRDASYRAILYNLLQREPAYREEFNSKQKDWSEAAFQGVFKRQLKDAKAFNEVYYRYKGNWYENDTLLLLEDVLILVEAKSGAAATIASPADTFNRHARDVQDLIVKAFAQCRRFLEYLSSAEEVQLYSLVDGRYEEVLRVRLNDYRVVLPIGLTVESYSPFSAGAKDLPGISPILGKFPFVSLAIDEIQVLDRFLPTTGQLLHYLSIRQDAASVEGAVLFDEIDHLGAYIQQNRFPDNLREQLAEGPQLLLMNGMSEVVDDYFNPLDWEAMPPPAQFFPGEISSLLGAMDRKRGSAWLEIDSHIRDFGAEGREQLAGYLRNLRATLKQHPRRYFSLATGVMFLFWLYRDEDAVDLGAVKAIAEAVCLSTGAERVLAVTIGVDASGGYETVEGQWISRCTTTSAELKAQADALKARSERL